METQTERRSNINSELFEITDEMKRVMEENLTYREMKQKEIPKKSTDSNEKMNFKAYDQSQSFFVTVSKENFLDAGHPAAIIDTVIEQLNLKPLYDYYSKEGNQAYHPKMMLKVLFYSYYAGIISCRTIWDAVIHRSDFIFLAAGQVPNFRTINDFRLRHLNALPGLFTQIVLMCGKLDMMDFKHLAIDGQKIQANASYKNSKNLKGIKKEYEKVKEGLTKLLEKEANEYFSEKKKKQRENRLTNKLRQLESFQKELEKLGDDEKRMNMVDCDAPVMTHKDGQKLPSYTHQSTCDGKLGVVTAVQSTQNNDAPEDLLPIVDQSIKNTGRTHESIMADCGFCNYDILQKVEEEREEEFYIPDRRFSKSQDEDKGHFSIEKFTENINGDYICPIGEPMEYMRTNSFDDGHTVDIYQGTSCDICSIKKQCTDGSTRSISIDNRIPYRDSMREKLQSDKGREIYMKRQGLIEPVHGDDQKNKGWIQHHLRGLMKAAGEFLLMRIATNLALMVKYRGPDILAWA